MKEQLERQLDALRAATWSRVARRKDRLGEAVRKANDLLGRPLASADEIAERRAFARGELFTRSVVITAPTTAQGREAAPVIVYHLDKHRRDLPRLTHTLDAADIPYRIISLEGDEATKEAVRRDAGGRKLPLVFIAGDCVGGREELHAMDKSGELRKRVFGG